MTTNKAKQDDLRRLMKERRENAKVKLGKIESPFAKYNSLGQLSCSICNVLIKSNNLWGPHVAGQIHKESLLKTKKNNATNDSSNNVKIGVKRHLEQADSVKKIKSNVTNDSNSTVKTGVKRHLEQADSSKRIKNNVTKPLEQPQSSKTSSLLAGYSSSDESDNEDHGSENSTSKNVATLPPDFFDNASTAVDTSASNTISHSEKQENVVVSNNVETLPEGFFDDPVSDAKARNIEYKDPVEEEWEKFQKTIAEETNVSKTIIEEDLEESTLERNIDQIDEQIQQWGRVLKLQLLADEVKAIVPKKDDEETEVKDGDSGTSDDELSEDDLLDWRSKGVKKLCMKKGVKKCKDIP